MYTDQNFKTKRALKEAVAAYLKGEGPKVTFHQPGPFGGNEPSTGRIFLEGPHYPAAHTWYAEAQAEDNAIVKVK